MRNITQGNPISRHYTPTMEGSNSSRTICLSPQIDLYFVKVSKICSVLAVGNLTLSTKEGAEEDAVVLLASVLNFLPTLGAISKI